MRRLLVLVSLVGCGPAGLHDGEACTDDDACASGTCLGEADGFPGGLCTTLDCTEDADCDGRGRACVRGQLNGDLCVVGCASDAACRPGYACRRGGWCLPAMVPEALAPSCDATRIDQDVSLVPSLPPLSVHDVRFEVADDTEGFVVVVHSPEEETVVASRLRAPDGETLDLLVDYAWLDVHYLLLGYVGPLLVPGAPSFAGWVQPGEYALEVGTTRGPVCHFLVEGTRAGTSLDLNLYFVGVDGHDAATAPDDPDVTEVLAELDAILGLAGIQLDRIRHVDVTGTAAETLRDVGSQDDLDALLRLGRAPGPDLDDLLSIDVYFVRGFTGDFAGFLGVAPSTPATVGLHGEAGSGLVVSASALGGTDGNRLTAQVIAHELGHFLGLQHTSDLGGGMDHLDDTPVCTDLTPEGLASCPDFDNVMFPITTVRDVVVTPDQAWVLHANPLVK